MSDSVALSGTPNFRVVIQRTLLLAGLLLLAGCDAPETRDSNPDLSLSACEDEQLQSSPAWRRAQCGTLSVPENPAAPEGRQIELNIVRLPAVSSSPQPDPLFILAGGPGQAATQLVDHMPEAFQGVNRQRDLVFVDQRGTGQSNPLNCAPEGETDFSLPPRESAALHEERLRECLASYDADLRFYTTPFAMDDLNQVRQALGYDQINLWGASYGTRAALVFMRRHPQAVRAAVLDSVAPTAIQLPYHALEDADNALRQLFANCASQPDCGQRFGDLETKTRRLISELDRQPRRLEVEHPLTLANVTVTIDGQLLGGMIRMALYERELGPVLPLAVHAATEGDFRSFTLLLLQFMGDFAQSFSLGMQQTILCAEDVRRPPPSREAQADSILQLELLESMQSSCEFWPRGILPDNYWEPVESELPTLLLSGELDPVTPPRWGDLAARSLSNSLHLRVPGAHHGVTHLGCLNEVVADFIAAADFAELDTACAAKIELLPPFIAPSGPSMLAPGGEG